MSMLSPRQAPSTSLSWGIALAAGSLLLIGGGTLVWTSRDSGPKAARSAPETSDGVALNLSSETGDIGAVRRSLPMPSVPGVQLHSVEYAIEHGTRVVKIKVSQNGDELIVDATTGRFLEARPSRSPAVPPIGKFAAPFDPMT
jgi:hypothetical protein